MNGRDLPWRKPSANVYQRVVSEVLLQRTRAEVVAGIYGVFFRKYPSWRALSQASESELQQTLKPIGLWQRRASSLVKLAKEMNALRGRFPELREGIDELPSVGQYVGNAIELFYHSRPAPLLDSGMARVLERVFGPRQLVDIRYDPYLQLLSQRVVDGHDAVRLNWAVLDIAATVCINTKPRCRECPFFERCKFRKANYNKA